MQEIAAEYPAIARVVAQLEAHEQAVAASKGQAWQPIRPTRDEIEDLIPGVLRLVSARLHLRMVDITESALDWALTQIDQAQREAFARDYAQGNPIETGGLMLLHQQIAEDVDVGVEEVEDEETGEELLLFEVTIPPALWERVRSDPAGAGLLVAYMQSILDLPPEG